MKFGTSAQKVIFKTKKMTKIRQYEWSFEVIWTIGRSIHAILTSLCEEIFFIDTHLTALIRYYRPM